MSELQKGSSLSF